MAKGVRGSSPSKDSKPSRTSFNILPLVSRKLKYIALMEEKDLTVLANEGFEAVIARYEKKHGPIPIK